MVGEMNDIEKDMATAVGLYALTDATLHEAATRAGVTSWALEETLLDAGLAEPFGIEQEADVSAEIDRLLEESS
jgi:hypothetical protein